MVTHQYSLICGTFESEYKWYKWVGFRHVRSHTQFVVVLRHNPISRIWIVLDPCFRQKADLYYLYIINISKKHLHNLYFEKVQLGPIWIVPVDCFQQKLRLSQPKQGLYTTCMQHSFAQFTAVFNELYIETVLFLNAPEKAEARSKPELYLPPACNPFSALHNSVLGDSSSMLFKHFGFLHPTHVNRTELWIDLTTVIFLGKVPLGISKAMILPYFCMHWN